MRTITQDKKKLDTSRLVWCYLSECVRKAWRYSGRKPSPALLQVVVVAAPLGASFFSWGHHYGTSLPEIWSLEVKTWSSCWTSDGGAIGVTPSLEGPLTETHLGRRQCGRWSGWPVCSGTGGAQGLCVGGRVQRSHCDGHLELVHKV
jgi:hypothetical protein